MLDLRDLCLIVVKLRDIYFKWSPAAKTATLWNVQYCKHSQGQTEYRNNSINIFFLAFYHCPNNNINLYKSTLNALFCVFSIFKWFFGSSRYWCQVSAHANKSCGAKQHARLQNAFKLFVMEGLWLESVFYFHS